MDVVVKKGGAIARQGIALSEGSVVQNVKEFKYTYNGVWASMAGSFTVTVDKDRVIVPRESSRKPVQRF